MNRCAAMICLLLSSCCFDHEAYSQAPKPAPKAKRAKVKRSPFSVKDQAAIKQAAQDAVKEMAALRLVYNRQKPWSESGCSGLVQEMGGIYNKAANAALAMSKASDITFDHVADFHDAIVPVIEATEAYHRKTSGGRLLAARVVVERLSNIDEDVLRAMRIGEKIGDPLDTQEAATLYVQGEFASMRLPRDDRKSFRDGGLGMKYSLAPDNIEALLAQAESLSYEIFRDKKYVKPKLDELYKQIDVIMRLGEKRRAFATDVGPNSDGVAAQELVERLRRMVKVLKEAEKRPVPAVPANTKAAAKSQ